jgi:hypothetical protein
MQCIIAHPVPPSPAAKPPTNAHNTASKVPLSGYHSMPSRALIPEMVPVTPHQTELDVKWLRIQQQSVEKRGVATMVKFLLFCILLVLCWPLALLALVLYPFIWLILLPFRIVGIAVGGVLELISALFYLPVRMLRAV